jgi:hypothetical protein
MNRPPQPADTWYKEHQSTCGGSYTKVSSPEPVDKGPVGKRALLDNEIIKKWGSLGHILSESFVSTSGQAGVNKEPRRNPKKRIEKDKRDGSYKGKTAGALFSCKKLRVDYALTYQISYCRRSFHDG